MEIDYRLLLMKYIQYVGDVEGCTFIYRIPHHASNVSFTEAEVTILKNLSQFRNNWDE